MVETTIVSFVLRFTRDDAAWRGVLRHVQSDEEIHFTCLEEALVFIRRYVDLEPLGEG